MPNPTDPSSSRDSATSPSLEVAPQVCEVVPDASVPLPEKVVLIQGQVAPAPPAPNNTEVHSTRPMVEATAAGWVRAMVEPGYGHALPEALDRVFAFSAMRAAVDLNLGAVAAPYNARLVPGGGRAVLSTAQAAPESDPMGIDQPRLTGLIAREKYLAKLGRSASWFQEAVQSQHNHTLRGIDEIVRGGVNRILSVLSYNTRLRTMLEDALEMIKGPSAEAQKTRAEKQKLVQETEARVRADEQKKSADKTPPTDPAKKP